MDAGAMESEIGEARAERTPYQRVVELLGPKVTYVERPFEGATDMARIARMGRPSF
jgi:hypothetical protein